MIVAAHRLPQASSLSVPCVEADLTTDLVLPLRQWQRRAAAVAAPPSNGLSHAPPHVGPVLGSHRVPKILHHQGKHSHAIE